MLFFSVVVFITSKMAELKFTNRREVVDQVSNDLDADKGNPEDYSSVISYEACENLLKMMRNASHIFEFSK